MRTTDAREHRDSIIDLVGGRIPGTIIIQVGLYR